MKNKKQNKNGSLVALVLSILIVAGMVFIYNNKRQESFGTLQTQPNAFAGNATNTSSTISTTSKEILSRDVNRRFASIVNNGANTMYIALVDDATASSTVNTGIRLNANGGSATFDNNWPYLGSVQALTDTGTSTATITYY